MASAVSLRDWYRIDTPSIDDIKLMRLLRYFNGRGVPALREYTLAFRCQHVGIISDLFWHVADEYFSTTNIMPAVEYDDFSLLARYQYVMRPHAYL